MSIYSWLTKINNSLPFPRKRIKPALIDLSEISTEENTPWWGHFLVAAEQSRYSKIGPIVLCIDHYNQEWKLAIRQNNQATENPNKILGSFLSQDEIKLKPILADRNMVVKLNCPLYIPTGGLLNLYVSTPAWIRIEIGTPPLLLDEVPTEILADTWSGENTLDGDLCYAGTSSAAPRLEDILQDTTHITTIIALQNFSRDRVYVHELIIPLPFLSVYSDSQNLLWTEQVQLSFENDALPRTVVTQGYPKFLENPSLLSQARVPIKARFKSLFGGGK
jgi:hypothetical protein